MATSNSRHPRAGRYVPQANASKGIKARTNAGNSYSSRGRRGRIQKLPSVPVSSFDELEDKWMVFLSELEDFGADTSDLVGYVTGEPGDYTLVMARPNERIVGAEKPVWELGQEATELILEAVGEPVQLRGGLPGLPALKKKLEEELRKSRTDPQDEELKVRKEVLKAKFRARGAQLPSGI